MIRRRGWRGSFGGVVATAALVALAAPGCTGLARRTLETETGGSAALFGQFRAFDGGSGAALSFAELTRKCAAADVVLFGEQHNDSVCNQLEAQLLYALSARRRPLALAMEFFETDTQTSLDAYLKGRIDEARFLREARQKPAYRLSHRPLIELARAGGIPVIAANAPRRLVNAYRDSGTDFDAFRGRLAAADLRWVPPRLAYVGGTYRERFMEAMREHPMPDTQPATRPASQAAATSRAAPATSDEAAPGDTPPGEAPDEPGGGAGAPESAARLERMYLAQLLWDNAMANAVANHRAIFPTQRVMLVVGVFHVERDGGTLHLVRDRRPFDAICSIVYRGVEEGVDRFRDADFGAGDVVVYGLTAPAAGAPRAAAPGGTPPGAPVSQPAPVTAPLTTQAAGSSGGAPAEGD